MSWDRRCVEETVDGSHEEVLSCKKETAYEMVMDVMGTEICIRDRQCDVA